MRQKHGAQTLQMVAGRAEAYVEVKQSFKARRPADITEVYGIPQCGAAIIRGYGARPESLRLRRIELTTRIR